MPKLVATHPTDVIEKALAGMAGRKDVINPAGWLVREIQAGGYAPPDFMRQAHTRDLVSAIRQAERAAELAQRDQAEQAARSLFTNIDQPPADAKADLVEQARARVARFSAAAAADENSPPMRAAMADLLERRQSTEPILDQAQPTTAGFLAHRGGWSLRRRVRTTADSLTQTDRS